METFAKKSKLAKKSNLNAYLVVMEEISGFLSPTFVNGQLAVFGYFAAGSLETGCILLK